MVTCIYRTHRFTWGIVTMHTQYGYKLSFHIWKFTFPIPLNSYPFNSSSIFEVFFCIYWDIIFRLACYYTSLASIALVNINCHSPLKLTLFFSYHLMITFLFVMIISKMISKCMIKMFFMSSMKAFFSSFPWSQS